MKVDLSPGLCKIIELALQARADTASQACRHDHLCDVAEFRFVVAKAEAGREARPYARTPDQKAKRKARREARKALGEAGRDPSITFVVMDEATLGRVFAEYLICNPQDRALAGRWSPQRQDATVFTARDEAQANANRQADISKDRKPVVLRLPSLDIMPA